MNIHLYIRKLRKDLPRWIVLVVDLYVVFFVYLICASVFLHSPSDKFESAQIFQDIVPVLLSYALGFALLGTHRRVVRYTSLRDLFVVLKACIISLGFLLLYVSISRSDDKLMMLFLFLVHSGSTLLSLSVLRVLYKSFYRSYVMYGRYKSKALIFGAGNLGVQTYSSIAGYYNSPFIIAGFIDDNIRKKGTSIGGIPVFHTDDVHADFISKHHITEVIFAVDRISSKRMSELVEKFEQLPVQLKRTPPFRRWLSNSLTPQMLENVEIEDLLGRQPIRLEKTVVSKEVRGKTILVTGAAGSIGSEIVRQLLHYPVRSVVLVDIAESALYELQQILNLAYNNLINVEFIVADVRDKQRMECIFNRHRPDIVYHAAAYKHVPLMEENPYEAIATNIKGTMNVVDLSIQFHIEKFVFVSTDKAVNPTNVMGATKRLAELFICSRGKNTMGVKFVTTRFGNVLGSNGSVVPLFKKQLKEGGPLLVTHEEITRYFMTIPEACQLVLEAGAMGAGGEIFVFDMGESVRIFDLAKRMITLSGLRYPEDVGIEITGLRPGEKIFEELLADGENTLPTHHHKIMIAKAREINIDNFEEKLSVLVTTKPNKSEKDDLFDLVRQIKELVPEYISQNSLYECLDRSENNQTQVVNKD